MIKPKCFKCNCELEDYGAILLSPPYEDHANEGFTQQVDKIHFCRLCFNRLIILIDGDKSFYRASGHIICDICKRPYSEHKDVKDFLSDLGEPYLKLLCNGDMVKL